MQKNLPKYTPDWVAMTTVWAEASRREVHYALCNDRRTLLWLANQRAVEYHPTLFTTAGPHPTHLILDLDPPVGGNFRGGDRHRIPGSAGAGRRRDVRCAEDQRRKGRARLRPLREGVEHEDAAAATRAIAARAARLDPSIATTAYIIEDRENKVFVDSTRAGGATVAAAYSPRVRPGVPVSFPLAWDQLDQVTPADFTISTALDVLGDRDPWRDLMPAPQALPDDLLAEGRAIPIARVQAMHEGKRRARARRQ